MRRGHLGVGGWRGENQRHFRPRGSGTPSFRPPRPFGLLDSPRFPPPGPSRQYRGPRPYGPRQRRPDNIPQSEHHERNIYRINNLPRSQDRGYHNRNRQLPPYHQLRQNDNGYGEPNFYKNQNQCHVNTMGDIDHRHQHQISSWTVPPFENNRPYYDEHRSPHKTPKHFNVGDDLPDYSGHRPPASDHYSSTTGPNSNNSQYIHSVHDTVDIIRKRLQNRDKQQVPDISMDHLSDMNEVSIKTPKENYQEMPPEQPVKRRVQRQRNIKSNCDKIKNKIVHQLFKMDKVKIHKLMDNPSSSTKFEYAISSLITEGQNSLNRHLRSIAEKSLCSSSTDFIQDDTNTIYEDTFMKQMQGILDPQDTVLLEDIKPLVMAELSRVLQLDAYQFDLMQDQGMQDHGMQNYETQDYEIQDHGLEEHEIQDHKIQDQEAGTNDCLMSPKNEPQNYIYFDGAQNTDQYSRNVLFEEYQPAANNYNNIEITPCDLDGENHEYDPQTTFESNPLFVRRPANKIDHNEERRNAAEHRQSRHSVENSFRYIQTPPINDSSRECPQPIPLFDPNVEQLSDDDDTFAEFDKQYHVAVDLNFLENASHPPSPPQSYLNSCVKSPSHSRHNRNIIISTDIPSSTEIKKEIDSQLQNIAKSPVKLFTFAGNTNETDTKTSVLQTVVKKEVKLEKENLLSASCECVEIHSAEQVTLKRACKKREVKKETVKQENAPNMESVLQSNTRKRSTDQKPSHRKEKRKRSSQSECQEAAKSFFNMVYINDDSNKETSKKNKRANSTEKSYSDKYVKRKEPQKKHNDSDATKIDESKKDSSTSSSHSNLSPKGSLSNEAPSKTDPKKKLKPIDMFVDQPKKANSHQAHRNTSTTPLAIPQSPDDSKTKPVIPTLSSSAHKLPRKHISTQTVILKHRTRECQTDKLKKSVKQTQTVPVSISISKDVATNPLERMKEIDMEIQLLLQEKFKLYNSLETKSMTVPLDTMPNLSMRVFKVNTEQTEERSNDSEDVIVDDFTSIPPEELEQIALETIADQKSLVKSNKRNHQHKVLKQTRKSSESPTTRRHKNKLTSPNISLIEQIITDDRPIEDIISLDDLETTPAKTKKKYSRTVPKKKSLSSKKSKISKLVVNKAVYDIQDCYVVLNRIDINNYFKPKFVEPPIENAPEFIFEVPVVTSTVDNNSRSDSDKHCRLAEDLYEPEEICIETQDAPTMVQVVEEVVNDLQFDMLDVSEDIIIDDNCVFVKGDDKANEKEALPEEIILDNSQSSMEDAVAETAGVENECKMYDYSTNENLRRDAITVTGNADAVLAIECIENDFLAACLDGNVYHFGANGQLLNTLRGTNQAVTCLTIVQEKYGTTVYTGSLDSRIRYYDLETGMEKGPECNVLSPIQTMDRAWDTVFVGTRTGFVLQFECKNNMLIPVSTVKFSEQSILALRAMKEGARKVLLVAARSESAVTVKDAQSGLLLRTLRAPNMSVYTLLFEDGKVYCGTSSHNIHVFDYTSGGHVGSHEGGKGAVCLRASGGLLFAGCYDGCVYVYRESEVRPLAQLRGPSLMLLSLAIQGTKIIAGYKDRGLYIWKMPLAIVQEMIL